MQNSGFSTRFFASLFTRITQWLADANNGINEFFTVHVHTKDLCVIDVWVTTRDQFAEVFGGSQSVAAGAPNLSEMGAPSGSSTEAVTTTDPATSNCRGGCSVCSSRGRRRTDRKQGGRTT